ncbi:MAG: type I DNA topoisomerase [Actinobacteria bacterium]|nr:type I DNA topoisomerase [Actinomycetota bacterium]
MPKGILLSTPHRLVIVESPAKAKTIQKYLGPGYEVTASVGHVRDLPERAVDVPAEIKKQPWGRMAIDVEDDFTPYYVVSSKKKDKVAELKRMLADADELLLATDEDREGEAIAWHLMEILRPKVPVRRMVFHEITPEAIRHAAESTRDLDMQLVDAQETRRLIDRLYGFEVSPVLWRKVQAGLSAGRVQSVATRLIVEKERERIAYKRASYWDIEGTFDPQSFSANLVAVDGKKIAQGKDFDSLAQLKDSSIVHLDEETAKSLCTSLSGAKFEVRSVDDRPYSSKPKAPFMTSTMQQAASGRLKWGAQRTMRVAQALYERGYITYMRTDSTTLSDTALNAARKQAAELYGSDHASEAPRRYDRKVKNAQEAHEAIRPAGDVFRTPAEVAGELVGDEFALYDLIWKRTVASQMADAKGTTATIRIGATSGDGRDAEFSASGTVITFRGHMAAYDDADEDQDEKNEARRLPALKVGDPVTAVALEPSGHSTNPPARYTEATLVQKLEELGIGRPSTYAAIVSRIIDQGYVWKRGSALVPHFLAFTVTRLMEENFTQLVDYDFTASLEEVLDEVANGEQGRLEVLKRFYFGEKTEGSIFPGLAPLVSVYGDIDARAMASLPIEGHEGIIRVGKYGPYLERGEGETLQRANIPQDLAPDEMTAEKAEELFNAPSGERELGVDPETERVIMAKTGRYGPYFTEVLPEGSPKKEKPRTASLFSTMDVEQVSLDDALRMFTLPREIGLDPTEGEPITSQNGRYGPYLLKGKDSRTLPDEESIFSCTLEEALALFAQPKLRRGRGQAAGPLKVVGVDPSTQKEVVVREGRFGIYITDGETNASLRGGDSVETISIERASDLLAERRAAGPSVKKPAARKAAAKKPPVKKKATAKKKAAKKTVGGTKVISGAAAKKAAAKTKTGVGSTPVESDVTPVG